MDNRLWHTKSSWKEDLEYTIQQISNIEYHRQTTKIVYSFIPSFHGNSNYALRQIKNKLPDCMFTNCLKIQDYARDNLHYDINTAKILVNEIVQKLNAPFV